MSKKQYGKLAMSIVCLQEEDVITTSGVSEVGTAWKASWDDAWNTWNNTQD